MTECRITKIEHLNGTYYVPQYKETFLFGLFEIWRSFIILDVKDRYNSELRVNRLYHISSWTVDDERLLNAEFGKFLKDKNYAKICINEYMRLNGSGKVIGSWSN